MTAENKNIKVITNHLAFIKFLIPCRDKHQSTPKNPGAKL